MATEAVKTDNVKLTVKDFQTPHDVRWCPGCGDYSILAQMQRVSPDLGVKKEDYVWVSGIGCSSRFPYYMDTYGFHGIHGRAPAIATGVKVARPDLTVWVAAGDGDLLSIGGNHFIHVGRRNLDIKILLFNNRIYGLTKGQFSPTSEKGKKTKSTPYGSIDHPFRPVSVALGVDTTFIARTMDRDAKHMQAMMTRAAAHKGTALIEVYQNCNIFNDGAFENLTDKETKPETTIFMEHDKPLVYGKNRDKGIRLNGLTPEIIDLTNGQFSENDCWIHNEFEKSPVRATILSHFTDMEGFPIPFGVFRQISKNTYDADVDQQIKDIQKTKGKGDLMELFKSVNTWEVS